LWFVNEITIKASNSLGFVLAEWLTPDKEVLQNLKLTKYSAISIMDFKKRF
jgi:hypothetical protein